MVSHDNFCIFMSYNYHYEIINIQLNWANRDINTTLGIQWGQNKHFHGKLNYLAKETLKYSYAIIPFKWCFTTFKKEFNQAILK